MRMGEDGIIQGATNPSGKDAMGSPGFFGHIEQSSLV